jgi:hypothetical protein
VGVFNSQKKLQVLMESSIKPAKASNSAGKL